MNRRDFLRLGASTAALSAACTQPEQATEQKRPNIIVTMADDMGFSDIGCYGGEVNTPVLNALAENGVRFRYFYNTARCCPTRASLVTGLYQHQAGVGHMMGEYRKDGVPLPAYMGDLNKSCVTFGEVFKEAGYSTLMSGKWHISPADDPDRLNKSNWPRQRGFDQFFGTIHGAGSFYDPPSLTRDNEPEDPGPDFYYTTAIADNARNFIDKALDESPDKPFFLYMPFTSPHWPLHAPDEAIAKYKGRYDMGWDALREERLARMKEMGVVKDDVDLSDRDPSQVPWEEAEHKEWQARRMEVYAAQIEIMDEAIGTVVDKLKERGEYENTLILFMADNGGCAEELDKDWKGFHIPTHTYAGDPVDLGNYPDDMPGPEEGYQSYGIPWANVSNTPFRYYKHWVHEGGISSPLIAHWPAGVTAPGTWSEEPSHLIDIMATSIDVAQAEYPATYNGNAITPLEGKSLAPAFTGEKPGGHPDGIFWEHEGNRAVRVGKWKLVSKLRPPENNRWELYDIDADRSELRDLAPDMPDKVEEMSGMWQAWADKVGVVEWRSWDT